MKKLAVLAILALALAIPASASAAYYTLNIPQLHATTYDAFPSSGTITNTSDTDFLTGTKWTGDINNPGGGLGWATFTLNMGGVDLSAYDGFGLCLSNVNENPWDLGIYAEGNGSGFKWVNNVAVGAEVYIMETWAGLGVDKTNITYLGFAARGDTPIDPNATIPDYTFEVAAQPLPEPGTLALFGFGLASGAAYFRRRKNLS